ncbi:MAG: hypothetical protein CAF41_012505 [Nitrospira sp. CG24A]|nr:MAG: hypothetical protein CAF41_012505 [Nitrospira sp. CG24A]
MRSDNAGIGHVIMLDFPLQRRVELGQMPVAFDPPQAGFDARITLATQRVFLFRRAPAIHLVGQLPVLGVERLQAIGRLETEAQGAEGTQPMQRQGFLQAFLYTGRCRPIDGPQLRRSCHKAALASV